MTAKPIILRKSFAFLAIVVALLAVLEFWISWKLRINPACGANIPAWVPIWLRVGLYYLAFPGWCGVLLHHVCTYGEASNWAPLAVALFTQFAFYLGSVYLVGSVAGAIVKRIGRRTEQTASPESDTSGMGTITPGPDAQ